MAFFLAENPREFVSGYQYNARKIAFFCDFYIEIYEMKMERPGHRAVLSRNVIRSSPMYYVNYNHRDQQNVHVLETNSPKPPFYHIYIIFLASYALCGFQLILQAL